MEDYDVVLVATHEDAEAAVAGIDALIAWLRTPEGAAAAADALDRRVPLMWPPDRKAA